MRSEVVQLLRELNREFYQSFAEPFAESRSRLLPGVGPYTGGIQPGDPVVDLGCGNGSLADALAKQGHRGPYLGVDLSPRLIAVARERTVHPNARFLELDLSTPGWSRALSPPCPRVFALAVLHHLPGQQLRIAWARELSDILPAGAEVVISVWNFSSEERYRRRIVPWSAVGLGPGDVERGDRLLDWRRGGRGLRYLHLFEGEELDELAASAGCKPEPPTYAGGASGRLNLVQRWIRS